MFLAWLVIAAAPQFIDLKFVLARNLGRTCLRNWENYREPLSFLLCLHSRAYRGLPTADKLTPTDSNELAAALAFALRFHGSRRVHNADKLMVEIVAKRRVEH